MNLTIFESAPLTNVTAKKIVSGRIEERDFFYKSKSVLMLGVYSPGIFFLHR